MADLFTATILVSIFFAIATFALKGLNILGILSAFIMALVVVYKTNFNWLFIMLTFLLIGTAATRLSPSVKEKLNLQHDPRTWKNVIANGSVAVVAACFNSFPAFVGAIAAVTADTLSCEIGELYPSHPFMITSLKPAPPGKDGAVSPLGEIAGILGGLSIGLTAYTLEVSPKNWNVFYITFLAALVGTNFDSLLGATFETKGTLDKHSVNLLASLSGALTALLAASLLP